VTKLDVLSKFETLRICVGYDYEGERFTEFPPHQTIFNKCRPVYEEFPGWGEDITGAKEVDELPKEARAFVDAIEESTKTPVTWVSTGPARDQIVRFRQGQAA
jgi:adenylosuccinate synthase